MNSLEEREEINAALAAYLEDEDLGCLQENDEWNEEKNVFQKEDEMDDILASVDLDFKCQNPPKQKCVTNETMSSTSSPSQKHINIVQTHFGHSNFRPMQWRIIETSLKGQDNIVVMATGYGKSLCYQFPAVFTGGVSVVVSPLISLMQDQVLGLKAANIEACFLGSAQTKMSEVCSDMLHNKFRVIYVTPEFVINCNLFETLHKVVGITLFAIDEAHCVSQWGHDFRGDYRRLGSLRQRFPSVPIMALTATATPKILDDIQKSLKLRNPVVTVTSFNRPNLFLEVKLKGNSIQQDLKPCLLSEEDSAGSTIVYCPTKKTTEEVSTVLKSEGIQCAMYHAGLTPKQRREAHERFVRDKVTVIVATIAFGMGINKPDVRRVVHYGSPRDMESYYQEIGRAGRDGLPSVCTVYYANKDFALHKFFMNQISSEQFRRHRMEMQNQMEHYLNLTTCRRINLLSHFTSSPNIEPSNVCCDNCNSLNQVSKSAFKSRVDAALDDEGRYDFSEDARKLFKALKSIGDTSMGTLVLYLRGSNAQRVRDRWKTLPTFGCGKHRSENYWKCLGKMMVFAKYLREISMSSGRGRGLRRGSGGFSSYSFIVVSPTSESFDLLSNKGSVCLVPSAEMKQELRYVIKINPSPHYVARETNETSRICDSSLLRAKFDQLKTFIEDEKDNKLLMKRDPQKEKLQAGLYKSLLELRNRVGDESGFMPYMVASNRTLLLMATEMPDSTHKLRKVDGMTEAKMKRFGSRFLDHISEFCREKNGAPSVQMCEAVGQHIPQPQPRSSKQCDSNPSDWICTSKREPPLTSKSTGAAASSSFIVETNTVSNSSEVQKQAQHGEENHHDNTQENELKEESSKALLNLNPVDYSADWMEDNDADFWNGFGTENVNLDKKWNLEKEDDDDLLKVKHKNVVEAKPSSPVHHVVYREKEGLFDPSQSGNGNLGALTSPATSRHLNAFRPKTSKAICGVSFDGDSPNSSDKSQSRPAAQSLKEEESVEEKYKRIRLDNKRKLEQSGWINTTNMKRKVKMNSLFRR